MMHDQPCTYNRQSLHISEVLRMADVIVDSHKANELKLYVTIQKQQRQVCGDYRPKDMKGRVPLL